MMKGLRKIDYVLVAGLIGFSILSILTYLSQKKSVVIDIVEVVNKFEMKKELDLQVEKSLGFYIGKLDSLELVLKVEESQVLKKRAKEMYSRIKLDYDRAVEISNQNINEQVWKRLNPLIDDFGKSNNFRVVLGANGMGSILYNSEAVDQTDQLIQYVNSKYQGLGN